MRQRIRSKLALMTGLLLVATVALLFPLLSMHAQAPAPPAIVLQPALMENLGRSLVAMRRPQNNAEVYVGWRLLGTDPSSIAFNLYRATGEGEPVKLNSDPITATTDYVDTTADLTQSNTYFVRPVVDGVEQEASNSHTVAAGATVQQFLSVPLQLPPGGTSTQPGTTVGSSNYTYSANDASVGDVDGDGKYEIILKWDPSNSRDSASAGLSGDVLIDAYKMDGTRLWRINLGKNIRAGAHYTQFMVYDLDGDGKAEVACKTADGSVDGVGNVIGDATKDYRSLTVPSDGIQVTTTSDVRFGRQMAGPEYFTIFNGQTGAALATTTYIPSRNPVDGWGGIGGNGNNDSVGNRADRFLAAIAYLDGVRPSVVMCRGYYGRSVLAAWDWRGGQLTQRWVFDSVDRPNPYSGMGGHQLSVADVDGDGKDEIIYHSMIVNDNGTGFFTTGLRHGDALHVSDLDPARPGLEVFGVHESEGSTVAFGTPGSALYDARTGEIIWSNNPGVDVGRGMCADIDPNFLGEECWGAPGGTRNIHTGAALYTQTPSSTNFAVWWDSDLMRELEDGTAITKWNATTRTTGTVLSATGAASNNGTKATPSLTADLLGDWREEVVWRASDNRSLRIYTTTIPATNRIYTLMHDRQYREAVAWQNVGYNQPPHPGFYLGTGMSDPPVPNIITSPVAPTLALPGDLTVEATGPEGATASFQASAQDLIGTPLDVTYSIQPGSTFALGSTAVSVSATDIYGNTTTGSFNVIVKDTIAPSLNVPSDITLEATGPAGAAASFAASATDTVSGDVQVIFSHPSGSTFALGSTQVTVSATDGAGNTAVGTFNVIVRDTTAPSLTLPTSFTLEALGPNGSPAIYTASASDIVSGDVPVHFSIQPGSAFALGTTTVEASATDAAGNTATGSFTVTVVDTTAPVFQSLTASPDNLGSPNHHMIPVTLTAQVSDAVDTALDTRIVSVTSNEPVDGLGDGDMSPDWEITGDLTLNLRAERQGGGQGRVYTITVESRDDFGNTSVRTVTVTVPKSQSQK
ncbi:MAG TPA: HYR domain-containing protein [Pyrinomonadaceae bacterium]|jgi:rhamnogalacturonan endolyase